MNSTLNPTGGGPDAVLAARADERLSHAYEQIARADEQLARVTEHLSKMEHDAVRYPAAVGGPRPSRDRPVLRGLLGLVLAGCIGAAAFASQSSYGEAVRLTIAQWAPNLVSTSSQWLARPANSAPSPASVQLAAVDAIPAQPASPAQDAAPAPAPMSPELTQMLQAMARDIAALQQGIEQLKANQERMAADNTRAIEQLKVSQEQVAHLIAKPLPPDPRAKTAAPAPKPVATAAPKPVATAAAAPKPAPARPPQAQARARSQPIQLQPDDQ